MWTTNFGLDNRHTLYSRLNHKATGRIILIMQRLHEDDLVGHVLKQESWEVVSLPAIAESDEVHRYATPYGWREHHRRTGEALHPDRESLDTLAHVRQTLGAYHFAGQYQQTPAPLEGWLYLAVLLDLYSRRVVGWAMGQRLTVELVEQALTMALVNRIPTAGLLHHSDRGSQYAATSYQRRLTEYDLLSSMSRKGNCWDNACIESFFGTLKRELVHHWHYATRAEATQDIFEYIEVFYNQKRRHSTLGYHSPAEYEARVAVA